MTKKQFREVRMHFLEWSGGFMPESKCEVTVYVDYALPSGVDPIETRIMLLDWMSDEAGDDPNPDFDELFKKFKRNCNL